MSSSSLKECITIKNKTEITKVQEYKKTYEDYHKEMENNRKESEDYQKKMENKRKEIEKKMEELNITKKQEEKKVKNTYTITYPVYINNKKVDEVEYTNLSLNDTKLLDALVDISRNLPRVNLISKKWRKCNNEKQNRRAPLTQLYNLAQASKSKDGACAVAEQVFIFNRSAVFCTENANDQAEQFIDNWNSLMKDLKERGLVNNFIVPNIKNQIIFLGEGTPSNKQKNIENAKNALLKNTRARVILTIHNDAYLKTIRQHVDNNTDNIKERIMVLDENDATVKNDNTILSKRDKSWISLLSTSYLVIGLSATPTAAFIGHGSYIESAQCIRLDVPDDYKGWNHPCMIKHNMIEHIDNQYYSKECTESQFPFHACMLDSIRHHQSLLPRSTGEPHIMGIKITNRIGNMRLVQRTLADMFPNCPSLFYIGGGNSFELYLPRFTGSLNHWKFKKNGKVYFDKYLNIGKYHQWKSGINYKDIITKIQDIYDEYGYTDNIFVIGGDKISRGLSFTNIHHKYRFTGFLYCPGNNSKIADWIQDLGRMNGRWSDPDDRHIYTTGRIILNTTKGIENTHKFMFKVEQQCLYDNYGDALKNIPQKKSDIPVVEMCKQFKMVDQLKAMNVVDSDYDDDDSDDDSDDSNDDSDDSNDYGSELLTEHKRVIERFKSWKNDDSLISKFMNDLDPKLIYTKSELRSLCRKHKIDRISDVTTYKKPGIKRSGYGKIMNRKVDGTYQLYKNLQKIFPKYF